MNKTPKISVVIPTKNRFQDIIRCIESILIQTLLPDEIVIVDSSDTEGLKSKLDDLLQDKLTFKYVHRMLTLTQAKNVGIKESIGDIIVFSDDDMIWDKDYLKEIIRVFNNYPTERIGGVTSNVIFLNELKDEVKKIRGIKKFLGFGLHVFAIIFFLPRYGSGCFQPSGMPTTIRNDVDKITKCEFLYGGSMSFRREVITEFMFDENFQGWWAEDDDIAYRVSRKYQNIFTPHAGIVHNDFSPSTSGNKYTTMKAAIESHYYLFKKNFPQDLKHKFAFWWSVEGLFIREGMTMVVRGDSSGVRGLASGFINAINKKV
jgi:glycosyltransferase involved in cell wall biosynthesis